MLDFYKWASENFWDFFWVTFVLVMGFLWVSEAIGDALQRGRGLK